MSHFVSVATPDGWLLIEDDIGVYKRRIVRPYYRRGDLEGLLIAGDPTEDEDQIAAALAMSPQEAQAQMITERDRLLASIPNNPVRSDGVSLGERTIDGTPAVGFEFTQVIEDHTYRCQTWFVWRPEGFWEINIFSAPDSTEIAPELIDALDTIRWDPISGYHPSSQSDQSSGQRGLL